MIARFFTRAAEAPEDRSILGQHAKRLLDDPVLSLALERIERRLTDTWRNTAVGDDAGREAAYRLHWAVQQLKTELNAILGNGRILDAEHSRREAERDRRARLG